MLLDLVYLLALLALSPWLLWRAARTGRYRQNLAAKLFGRVRITNLTRKPVAWFHAVSVGEVNLLGTLVPAFRKRHPDWHIVISSTTDTGLAEAKRRFADLDVIAWPFDFTWAVAAALGAVKPSLVVLAESELWPNFLAAARQQNVPVVVVNARMSPRSFRRLKRVAGLARQLLFRHVTRFAVQEADYTDRLRQLGVPGTKLVTTGSIKYDGALRTRSTPETERLRGLLGLVGPDPSGGAPLVLLAGSTHAPEEAIVLDVFARLRTRFQHVKLLLVPRHPDRFEEVVRLVEASQLPFVRRSTVSTPLAEAPAVVLLDTVGELGAAWGLADVGFTGGSLDGVRGGQSMIEPAGYGVPCVFGPHVWNFRDAAKRLVEAGGAVMVPDANALEAELMKFLTDPDLRARMGRSARELVQRQQGATFRTLDVINSVIPSPAGTRAA
ncbi:3-deoxy-D-manno-octulosonic acid transferase [Gemmata sp. JC717]|uniref:3-deoxy-D-manno-octulosonic acid transferase n=1 Tax=Gemmata algarum TaxID=2975278 RepID=UPI0021BB6286|nr:3-deoxy-D-manno-octulosonic acid transferase [Gemmata algarum]MDY3551042.1 3-deoxy-D-manno-octulosonic acid transferase [Gemmata algarum]